MPSLPGAGSPRTTHGTNGLTRWNGPSHHHHRSTHSKFFRNRKIGTKAPRINRDVLDAIEKASDLRGLFHVLPQTQHNYASHSDLWKQLDPGIFTDTFPLAFGQILSSWIVMVGHIGGQVCLWSSFAILRIILILDLRKSARRLLI